MKQPHFRISVQLEKFEVGGEKESICSSNSKYQKASVKYFRFHPLRHAGASFIESIGVPISHIQELLGHENRKTTETYLHSVSKDQYEVIQRFEEARSLKYNNCQKNDLRQG